MKKKGLLLVISGILVIGSITGFTYAKVKDNNYSHMEQTEIYTEMTEIMEENGYEDVAKFMENRDYEAMDEFMNNLTDEDYENMITIMKENGYGGMARMMESIDKDEMIAMHNSMGGDQGCHSDSEEI